MCEEKQDLEDYIQYNFDEIPSFKLALFVNSGKIEVKVAFGQVEESFPEKLLEFVENVDDKQDVFHLDNREFSRKTLESDNIFVGISGESRIFSLTNGNNTFIVYCCGKTFEKDEPQIRELISQLLG